MQQDVFVYFEAYPWIAWLSVIGATCASIAGIPRLINSTLDLFKRRAAAKIAEKIYLSTGVASFTKEDIAHACRNYVPPACTQTDPCDDDELHSVVALAPLFKSIDEHFAAGGQKRHVILLADSGMGKTSFCLNYLYRELKKKKSVRRPIAIVSLGRGDALAEISRIPDKRNTVCFLDAFDEDPHAVSDPTSRLQSLMVAAADCRNIVVTCRSQFFSKDDAIPRGSGIMYVAARKAGQGRELPLHRLFLAPLSPKQIRKYLRNQFPIMSVRNWSKRRAAGRLISTIPELSARPMLLELVPDLIRENRSISDLFGLYTFLVDKWLERESDWISRDDLLDISVELAVRSYLQQRAGRGDRIAPATIEELARDHRTPLESWKLKSRSLLNRDIEGQFKFAHRSVLEYLFLTAALAGDARCFTVEWTDLMKDLFVSWGNTAGENSEPQALMILSRDHSKTGLFPLASPLTHPQRRSVTDCRTALTAKGISFRQSRSVPIAWRNRSLNVSQLSATASVRAYEVHDSTHGITWLINDISGINYEERPLYREQSGARSIAATARNGEKYDRTIRAPSIEELLTLWESEPFLRTEHGVQSVFDRSEFYWIGDSGDNGPLLCSFGELREQPHMRHLVSRNGDNGRSIHLYELQNRYGLVDRLPYRAVGIYVLEHPI